MVRKLEVPFRHVDELRREYGDKFLVITNCIVEDQIWNKSGILQAVCDTYQECLDTLRPYYDDFVEYGEVRDYHFPHRVVISP